MIILYHGSGASFTEVFDPVLPDHDWLQLKQATNRLLVARSNSAAAAFLGKYPFKLLQGTNYFRDEFAVLYAVVTLEDYVEIGEIHAKSTTKEIFRAIAETLSEIGPFTRFVAIALDTDETVTPVAAPSPRITSEAVERALSDAENLIRSSGASSAVDRVHTALHGYLRAVLDHRKVRFEPSATIMNMFKLLRENEARLREMGEHSEALLKLLRAMATIIDTLNDLRNSASGAHPTDSLLEEPEAILAINAARTLLHFLDQKLNT